MPEYASSRLVFVCGSAIRLPASIVTVASAAAAGAQTAARSPTPSKYTRNNATKPAAFGATLSHATKDVGPRRQQPERQQRRGRRLGDRGQRRAAGGAVDKRQAVRHDRRRDRADEE